MSRPNVERNREIVEKRESGWSIRRLSRFYHLTTSTVHEIYHRDRRKYGKKKSDKAFGVIHTRRLAGVRS